MTNPSRDGEKEALRYHQFSIELDSPPFQPRPSELLPSVLEGTGIEPDDFETGSPFFGHQTFILKEDAGKDELFTASKPVFKERITALYNSGAIRYGTW